MKLKISWNWMFYILCLLCFTFCSKNEAEPPPPANGQIKVIVKNSLGTRMGAVNLTLVNGKTFLYGITQENGEFTFNKVPIGENTIIASVEHYLNESVTTKLSADEETSINIEMK